MTRTAEQLLEGQLQRMGSGSTDTGAYDCE
jgi:hypothetical protein